MQVCVACVACGMTERLRSEAVLVDDAHLGWQGHLWIRLAVTVYPIAFHVQHIPSRSLQVAT